MKQNKNQKNTAVNQITEGVVWKQLLIFFFPDHAGNFNPTIIYNRGYDYRRTFVGKAALASVGGPAAVLSTIVVTFFNGLANGAAVVIAQYYGAKDKGRLHTGLHTAYLFSIVVSLVISVVGAVLTPWLLKIMNTPQDMMASSTTYLRIYFMGILFTLVYNMGAAIMRAVGRFPKRPASLSGGLLRTEYRSGYIHGSYIKNGNCRSSTGNRIFPVCQRISCDLVFDKRL